LRDIGDARIAIEETISGEGAAAEAAVSGGRAPEPQHISRLRRALPWALGAIAVLLAAFAAWLLLQPKPRQNVVRFPVQQPEDATFFSQGMASISPDGRTLAFVAQPGLNKPQVLWLRPLDSLNAQPVPGTDNVYLPFWSPDSQWIGFIANGKLEKVAASGGAPQILCDDEEISSSTWSRDGVILFTGKGGGLYRVPDTGGTPTLVDAPDQAHSGIAYGFPQFLPDGRHFLVALIPSNKQVRIFAIAVGSLDSKTVKVVLQGSSQAVYAAPGYLFYLNQSTLMARPFDAGALRFTGPAAPVAQNVASHNSIYGYFSVSSAGVLAYMAGAVSPQDTPGQMAWFNRAGEKLGTVGESEIVSTPALSPDGTRVAVTVGEYQKHDIWIYDLKRGAASRLTFSPADDYNPIWSRDGSMIFFSSNRSGQYGIYRKAADGLGGTQPVSVFKDQAEAVDDLSPDGRYAIYDTTGGNAGNQLWGVPLFGDRKPFPFVQGNAGQGGFSASNAQFSPNGRYLAYSTDETGRQEVYVQTFPQHTGKWQISVSGGSQPMWRRDSKELFYLNPGDNATLMSAAVNTDSPAFQAAIPKPLFQAQLIPLWYWKNIYAPSSDGQRFLMIVPAGRAKLQPITVVVNWPALLKK
jgi:Tol biopolymer transport system component